LIFLKVLLGKKEVKEGGKEEVGKAEKITCGHVVF